MRAEAWAAIGTCVGAGVAVAAAIFAAWQVWELRSTRERQTQPNVVAFIRPNAKAYQILDLVVANYGLTPAYHVTLDFPPLTVSPFAVGAPITELHIPDEIAVLAPGQEWQAMWDAATSRHPKRDELGSRFTGVVNFEDRRGKKFDNPAILDWDTHYDTLFVGDSPSESANAVAKEIAGISGILKSYQAEHNGIWTYPVPPDEEREYRQIVAAQMKAQADMIKRMLYATHEQPAQADTGDESEQGDPSD
jgi:hypothetical protein